MAYKTNMSSLSLFLNKPFSYNLASGILVDFRSFQLCLRFLNPLRYPGARFLTYILRE